LEKLNGFASSATDSFPVFESSGEIKKICISLKNKPIYFKNISERVQYFFVLLVRLNKCWDFQMNKTIFFIIILNCLTWQHIFSSFPANDGRVNYTLKIHAGTGLPHTISQVYFNQEYLRSIELNSWFDNQGKDEKNYSLLGAGYIFSNLGNYDVYGNYHAAFLGVLSPHIHKYLPVQFKMGLGIAYATKRYDVETNFLNRAIGSHLNFYGQLTFTGKFPVSQKFLISPGVSFHHISNGTVMAPNQGINMLTFSAGMEIRPGHRHPGILALDRDRISEGRNRFSVIYAPGIKQVDRLIDKHIFTSSLIFDYGYNFLPERSIGLGISFFYNDTWAYFPYTREERDTELSPFQSALHLSLQKNMGPLAFIIHPGLYIYHPAREWPYQVNRIGLKYSLENNLTFQFSIKAHWLAVADYFEWGIGYEFNR
jgi:hypothetical protein